MFKKVNKKISNVCVFCGSRFGANKEKKLYIESAREIGKLLADNNINLIFGSGSTGLMGEVSKTCLDNGGKVYGFTTKTLMNVEVPQKHKNHKLTVLKTIQERKLKMINKSDAFVVLPGGFGTFDEIFDTIVSNQIQEIKKPIYLVNVNEFYTDFYNLICKGIVQSEFAGADTINIIKLVKDARSAFKELIK